MEKVMRILASKWYTDCLVYNISVSPSDVRDIVEELVQMKIEKESEKADKEMIEDALRRMCFGRSMGWSESLVDKIYNTNVFYDTYIEGGLALNEDLIVAALMEIVSKDKED